MNFYQIAFPEKTFLKILAKMSGLGVITLQYYPFNIYPFKSRLYMQQICVVAKKAIYIFAKVLLLT